jgi:serine/threonine protein kinase
VKVLDFGLAKVLADHAPGDQRLSVRGPTAGDTRAGMILGTAAYMSPEQARGQAVDKRTDIWAFCCVLYEILTGRPAFAGATPSDTIAAVLTHGPDLAALPPEIALPLARLIKRCLEKDPARRQRDIGDARFELAMDDDSPIDRPGQGRLRGWRRRAAAAVGLMAIVAGSVLLGVFVRRPSPPVHATPVRFSVLPPQGSMFFHNVATTFLALSPDGSQLAFVTIAPPGPRRIWLRPISGLAAYAVPGTEGRCRSSGRLTVDRSVFSRAAN